MTTAWENAELLGEREDLDQPLVMPIETDYWIDLFEKTGHSAGIVGPLPDVLVGQAKVQLGPVCIIGLQPIEQDGVLIGGGRRYLWVRPSKQLIEHLATQLRVAEPSSVHFKVKIHAGRALIVAIQGNDPGPEHWVAIIRADSIPGDADVE